MKAVLAKAYNPQEVETKIYQIWEKSGFFNPDKLPNGRKKKPFVISMPPPNVTGDLHLGHATALTLEDILIRFKRMKGYASLWVPGMDHAGIATQIMVERLILRGGLDRYKLGRQKFIKKVWQWKERYGTKIDLQIRQLGASCDWSREHFTMDQDLSRAVQEAFIKLYKDGLIYRGKRIINWCPRCASAISDLEVRYEDRKGYLWYIRYPILEAPKGERDYIIAATTRPETMLGDTAVAVHPRDSRYKKLVGKKVLLPLMNREIPIIADMGVDQKFGSGAVKITPAHDPNDYEIGLRHRLSQIQVIGPDGKMTSQAGQFQGMNIIKAREAIISKLRKQRLLFREEEYTHSLGCCDRCGKVIEPLISKQWFVKTESLAKPAIKAVQSGRIKIIPRHYEKVYFNWMNNIQDWCISRQLWWGHQIPVWYRAKYSRKAKGQMGFHGSIVPQVLAGKTKTYRLRDHKFSIGDIVAFENSQIGEIFGYGKIINVERKLIRTIRLDDPDHGTTYTRTEELIAAFKQHHPEWKITPATKAFIYTYTFIPIERLDSEFHISSKPPRGKGWIQDPDTLDTWFSSGLWTFSTLGWPQYQKKKASLRDLKAKDDLNRFHPTDVMETGWDILFFWIARMIMMSLYLLKEIPFKTVYLHGLVLDRQGKKMSKSKGTGVDPQVMTSHYGTDAIRFSLVLGATAGQDMRLYEEKIAGFRNFVNKLWNISRYILSLPLLRKSFQSSSPKVQTLSDKWILSRLHNLIRQVTANLENFNFSEAGIALYKFTWHELADWYLEISKIEKNYSLLGYILDKILKLLHPFIPFVTEEIWGRVRGYQKSQLLLIQEWPKIVRKYLDKKSEKEFKIIQDIITSIRNIRADYKIKPSSFMEAAIKGKEKLIKEQKPIIEKLARVKLTSLEKIQKIKGITLHLKGIDIFLPLADLVDLEKEKNRLAQDLAHLEKLLSEKEIKLKNRDFLKKAPEEVVEEEKNKLREYRERSIKLRERLKILE